MLRNILRSESWFVRYSRNLRSISHSSTTKDRCDSMSPAASSPDECPPKMRCLMDLYPVPCGSWKENYDAKNAIYNRQLIAALATLVITLFTVNRIGIVKGYPEIRIF